MSERRAAKSPENRSSGESLVLYKLGKGFGSGALKCSATEASSTIISLVSHKINPGVWGIGGHLRGLSPGAILGHRAGGAAAGAYVDN
jgi:hypothetical protein